MERHCSIETKFPSGLKSSNFFSRELDYFSAKRHWNRNVFGNRTASFGRTGKSKRTTCLGQYHCAEKFPSGTKRCINISTEISGNFRLMGSTHRWFSTNSNFPSIVFVSCFYRRLYAESESHSNYGVRHMSPLAVPIFDVYSFISWLIIFHLQLRLRLCC